MQFCPQRSDLEKALIRSKPPQFDAPPGKNSDIHQIHQIFLNTPLPPEILENSVMLNNSKKQDPPPPKNPRKQRDLQAELRALNLVPNSNEGPKRGSGTLLPQQDNQFMPGMPIMPGAPPPNFFPHFGARHVNKQNGQINMDPNNYDDFQDIDNDNEEEGNHEEDINGNEHENEEN